MSTMTKAWELAVTYTWMLAVTKTRVLAVTKNMGDGSDSDKPWVLTVTGISSK